MKQRFENTLVYLIIEIILFNGLPVVCLAAASSSGQGSAGIFGLIYNALPMIDVCIALAAGFFFGKKHGGDWLMSIVSALAFIPCVYIFFNATAWIYVVLIGIGSIFSVFIGTVFKNRFIR